MKLCLLSYLGDWENTRLKIEKNDEWQTEPKELAYVLLGACLVSTHSGSFIKQILRSPEEFKVFAY